MLNETCLKQLRKIAQLLKTFISYINDCVLEYDRVHDRFYTHSNVCCSVSSYNWYENIRRISPTQILDLFVFYISSSDINNLRICDIIKPSLSFLAEWFQINQFIPFKIRTKLNVTLKHYINIKLFVLFTSLFLKKR